MTVFWGGLYFGFRLLAHGAEGYCIDYTIKRIVMHKGAYWQMGVQKMKEHSHLLCQCWCGRKYINIPIDDVASGVGATCDRDGCGRPDGS